MSRARAVQIFESIRKIRIDLLTPPKWAIRSVRVLHPPDSSTGVAHNSSFPA